MAALPQLLSVARAAEILDCSRGHIYDLIKRGEIPASDIGIGRAKTRITEKALAAYIASTTRTAGAA